MPIARHYFTDVSHTLFRNLQKPCLPDAFPKALPIIIA